MSSFELLELFGVTVTENAADKTVTMRVDFAPDEGALAMALRHGERPEWQQMAAQSANELAVLRAAYVPDAQADEYSSRLFFPASKLREFAAQDEELQRIRRQIDAGDDGMAAMWTQQEV